MKNCDKCNIKDDCRYYYPCEFESLKAETIKKELIEKAKKAFCSASCEGYKDIGRCFCDGNCDEFNQFVKLL